MWRWIVVVGASSFLSARGEPYTPTSDDEVLERLPPGLKGADFRRQREDLARDPDNLRDSTDLARGYLDTAQAEGDPRFTGYARAMLEPWWDQASPPAPVLVLRARIRAEAYEFDRALRDLETVLSAEPAHPTAGPLQFDVLLARGDLDGAARVLGRSGTAWSALMQATAAARLGRFGDRAEAVYAALRSEFNRSAAVAGGERQAAGLLLADLAQQLGRAGEAEEVFVTLGRTGGRDVRRLAQQADWGLANRRYQEVAALVRGELAVDSLAVRWLEAMNGVTPRSDADESLREVTARQLTERFAARRRRADVTGLPDEARFRLRVLGDKPGALKSAEELWSLRRWPSDARLLVEAAAVAQRPGAGRPAWDWIRTNRLDDVRLAPWRVAFEGSR